MAFLLAACKGTASEPGPRDEEPVGCATGEVLDGEVCVPVACGVGTWGNIAVDGATIYVSMGGTGNGTEANPMGSIQAGVDAVGALGGGLVAVSGGIYFETIAMGDDHRNVTLAGRCRELVTIDGSGGEEVPAIEVIGERLRRPEMGIAGVTVTGGRYVGVWVQGAEVSMTASDIRANLLVGVLITDADVTLDGVGVHGTQTNTNGEFGRGIDIEDGATLTARDCTVQGNTEYGVGVKDPGTAAFLDDVDVLETLPSPDGNFGYGVQVTDGGLLSATRCVVEGNTSIGVFAAHPGTTVDLLDTEILDTSASPEADNGYGILVLESAALAASGCTVRGSTAIGVHAQSPGTTVDLVDTEVLDTSPRLDGTGGRGIEVLSGAALTATGCIIKGNTDMGVLAAGAETSAHLVGTQVRDTAPRSDGMGGRGIAVQDGATLLATGCTVQRNAEVGVYASNPRTTVDLVATEILDTLPRPDGTAGHGIEANDAAAVTATRCSVESNTEVGVAVSNAGTTVDLVDTQVLGTRRGRVTGFALGIIVQEEGRVQASDCEVSGTEGPGLYVTDRATAGLEHVLLGENRFDAAVVLDATLTITASRISDTLPDPEWGGGFGVYLTDHFGPPTLTLTDSTIGPHDYAAVWLDGQGTYDLHGNTLSGSEGTLLGSWPAHGNAVFAERGVTAWDGANGLRLTDNSFDGATEIAVLLDGASASLTGNTWSDNGGDVWQQRCDGIVQLGEDEPDWDSDWTVCPDGNILTAYDVVFTSLYLPEVEPE